MSEEQNQKTSSRGRVLRTTGMGNKQMSAIQKMRDMKNNDIKRTDQYEVEETREVFESIDDAEYERRQAARAADDFIVDDDGIGYNDRGGEIWEHEDQYVDEGKKGKKARKLNPKGNGAIEQFMQPTSALAQKKKMVITQSKASKVTAEQSKNIMDGLMNELDDQDEDDLQDINIARAPGIAGTGIEEDNTEIAFNKQDQMNLKYNVTTGSKKRTFHDVSASNGIRKNPFAKAADQKIAPPEESQINSSAFQSAVDNSTIEKPASPEQETPAAVPLINTETEAAQESAIEKEWQQIKAQNEQDRSMMAKNSPLQSFDYPVKTNADGSLSFYWIDAHEENYGADIYLFGKVWQPEVNAFVSCALQIKGMERTLFALPKMKNNKARGSLSQEEENAQQQAMVIEFNNLRKNRFKNIQGFKCKLVSRKYAFEMPISHGEHKFLKIKYPAENPPLPANLTGNTFECIFGANQSMLELFILKRKIKGPCWLTITNFQKPAQFKHTWCKQELILKNPKDVTVTIDDINKQSPPLTSLSFSMKTCRSANNTNEIAMISCLISSGINQDGPTSDKKLQRFTLMRNLDKKPWPFDLQQKLKRNNDQNIALFNTERQMLEALIARFYQTDPDILLSHNLCGSVFEIIMARIQFFNVPHWSRIGRLKKSNFPTRKLDQGGYSGSSWIPRMVSCGRLLVDTFVSSKELVKETNYDLGYLAQRQLKTARKDFDDDMLKDFYLTSDRLLQLVGHTETDTFLTFKLMLHLNIIPLTKQLTGIAGNLWFRSLQNARAERNEMFLLHEFRARKYLCPDKKSFSAKEAKKMQFGDEDEGQAKTVKGKRQKAKYGGGLVLEPKAGFYDSIVMMLDFNSLYPSIIQEYNLCFTTVERKHTLNFDGSAIQPKKADPALLEAGAPDYEQNIEDVDDDVQVPSGKAATSNAILPNVLRNLVQKRRLVKQQMKGEKDPIKYQQLNIRQTALKLTANSMYGCLGFGSSRFHAQAIAALITRTGRETLLKTKDIAENKFGYSVIYGDTDSIMINTGTNIVKEAIEMGKRLKAEVNVLYKCLEIEIDGIFKSMLLLKKKKYAALVVENPGTPDEKITTELKGLDMVRRDWCPLSKNVGNFVLTQILSGKQREDIVMALNEYLSGIGNQMKAGETPLSEYIITKQLTRNTNEYSDAKSLPHVQVAIRMKSQGKSDAELVNNFIPYVICETVIAKDKKKASIGDMAYSPDEFLSSKSSLKIDVDWYINQQLLPPITRLIEHIEGIEIDFVAQCLGVDGKKYKFGQHNSAELGEDGVAVVNPIMKTETTEKLQDRSVATLKVKCPFCDNDYEIPEIFHKKKGMGGKCSNICPNEKCGEMIPDQIIGNRVKLFLKQLQFMYYKGQYKCREPDCANQTRQLLINGRCNISGCKGRVVAKLSEQQANDTLRYLQGLFNVDKYLNEIQLSQKKLDTNTATGNKDLANIPHREMLEKVMSYVDEVLNMSKYNKVDLKNIFSFMSIYQGQVKA